MNNKRHYNLSVTMEELIALSSDNTGVLAMRLADDKLKAIEKSNRKRSMFFENKSKSRGAMSKKYYNVLLDCALPFDMKVFNFDIRGKQYDNRNIVWDKFLSDMSHDNAYLIFETEPTNEYDKNAIKVISRGSVMGDLGYVGKEYTKDVRDILSNCKQYYLYTHHITDKAAKATLYYR